MSTFPTIVIEDPKVELLTILVEECAEVIQEATKALRFGIENHHPAKEQTNLELLSKELGQVAAMVRVLRASGMFREHAFNAGMGEKLEKLALFSHLPEEWIS